MNNLFIEIKNDVLECVMCCRHCHRLPQASLGKVEISRKVAMLISDNDE